MPIGRPHIIDDIRLGKLEEAFAIGAGDKEACFYANINPDTLYEYQKKNPEFTERKASLKQRPVLLARQTVLKALETDVITARWYLERKRKDEFSTKIETDNTIHLPKPLMDLTDVLTDNSNPEN